MATNLAQLSDVAPEGPNFEIFDDHIHRIVLAYLPPAAACQFVATSSAIWTAVATDDAQAYWLEAVRMSRWPRLHQVAQRAHVDTTCASQLRHLAREFVALATGVLDRFPGASMNASSGAMGIPMVSAASGNDPSAVSGSTVPTLASSSEGNATFPSTHRPLPPSVLRVRWLAAEHARRSMLQRFTPPTLPLSVTWAPSPTGPVEPSATTKGWEVVDGGQFARQVRALLMFATSADLTAALQQGVATSSTSRHSNSSDDYNSTGSGVLAVAETPGSHMLLHRYSNLTGSGSSRLTGATAGGGGDIKCTVSRVNGEARAQATAALVTVFAVAAHAHHRLNQLPQSAMDGALGSADGGTSADGNETLADGPDVGVGNGEVSNVDDDNRSDDESWWLDGLMPAPDPHLVSEITELLSSSPSQPTKRNADLLITLITLLAQWTTEPWLLASTKVIFQFFEIETLQLYTRVARIRSCFLCIFLGIF